MTTPNPIRTLIEAAEKAVDSRHFFTAHHDFACASCFGSPNDDGCTDDCTFTRLATAIDAAREHLKERSDVR